MNYIVFASSIEKITEIIEYIYNYYEFFREKI